jgi:type III pantothenate kinase
MLLAIDIGNSNMVLGVYRGKELVTHWRLVTQPERTVDEYGALIGPLAAAQDIGRDAIDAIIVSCVVPPMVGMIDELGRKFFGVKPLMVGPGLKTGMPILYDSPQDVGADRIANGVAAYDRFHAACVVIDFGTATTFDCVSENGEYLGGLIAPGLIIAVEALFQRASKLPRVEVVCPASVIGKSTVHSIQSGVYYGYVGLVDGIVQRIERENRFKARVVATGGVASLIAHESAVIEDVDEFLTLEGLRLIYEKNAAPSVRKRRS